MTPLNSIGVFLVGWVVGVLVNYLSDVLPYTRRFSRTTCLHCQQPLTFKDYVFYQRCPNCEKGRKVRAWVVLVLGLGLSYALALFPLGKLGFWASLVLLVYFGVVALIDLEHRIIMHPVSLVGAVIAVVIGIWQHGWQSTLIGGAAGLGIMLVIYLIGIWFARWLAKRRKTQTEEEALGFGDVALTAVLGLLLGWPGIIGGLTLAVLLGGVGSLIVIVYALLTKKYHAFMAIPYGPFLILGAAILLFRAV